jgi:protein-disulfide isomerase
MMIKKRLLSIAAICGIVSAGLASFFIARHITATEETAVYFADDIAIDTAGYPFRGNEKAAVSAVVCFDVMCKYCDSLHCFIDSLSRIYGGQVKFYEKPYALLSRHSDILTRALLAAQQQDAYWTMVDKLFLLAGHGNKDLSRNLKDSILHAAENLELDIARFEKDMESAEIRNRVTRSTAEAERYGITSIPLLFIDGRMMKGYKPFPQYVKHIERSLSSRSGIDSARKVVSR